MTRTDEELVLAHGQGDREALEELIERYLKPIYAFVRRLTNDSPDADDITQEVFVKVWRNLRRFDARRSFKPWIFRIAKNATADYFRKKRPLYFSSLEDNEGNNFVTDNLPDLSPLPDELLHQADIGRLLLEILGRLPHIYRQVLLLRHNDHFSFDEIAETLETPVNTIKSRHRRGLLLLRKEIKDDPTLKLEHR